MSETAFQMAIRHVSTARRIVEDQKSLIAELRRDGHSTGLAEDLLRTYEASLAAFEHDVAELAHAQDEDLQR